MINKLFKWFCAAIALLVCGTLGFRLYTLNHYPAFARGVLATETLQTAYANGGLDGITWEPRAYMDAAGDFFIHQPIYFPSEETLIVTVRYNDSLLTELRHDGGGDTLSLDVTLYADGTERIRATDYTYGYAYDLYSYRRYVFEGVTLADYKNLYLDIYLDTPDYNVAPYSSLGVYESADETEPYKLTARDKKALR